MPDYRRIRYPGVSIFFTVCLEEDGSNLLIREIDALRCAFRSTMVERPFLIDAIVVLPDHLHTVWTLPLGDSDYSTRWAVIKSRFTQALPPVHDKRPSQIKRSDAGIWQRQYWEHRIKDVADFVLHKDYCLTDPVRHGLVKRPEEWQHSSIHRDIDRLRQGFLAAG